MATWLPDHVLRWIGAQAHSLGEDRDENKINAMAVGAFRSGERATRGAHRAAGQGLQKFRGTKKGAEEAGNAQHEAGRVTEPPPPPPSPLKGGATPPSKN